VQLELICGPFLEAMIETSSYLVEREAPTCPRQVVEQASGRQWDPFTDST